MERARGLVHVRDGKVGRHDSLCCPLPHANPRAAPSVLATPALRGVACFRPRSVAGAACGNGLGSTPLPRATGSSTLYARLRLLASCRACIDPPTRASGTRSDATRGPTHLGLVSLRQSAASYQHLSVSHSPAIHRPLYPPDRPSRSHGPPRSSIALRQRALSWRGRSPMRELGGIFFRVMAPPLSERARTGGAVRAPPWRHGGQGILRARRFAPGRVDSLPVHRHAGRTV